jgi:ABC-2 type transport system permease protein
MVNLIGFYSLIRREISRFIKLWIITFVPTIITTFLYMFIFGFTIGKELPNIQEISYLEFIVPGLILMGVITSSFTNNSTSLFMMKWMNFIENLLISPLSYIETVSAFIIGGVVRGTVTGMIIYVISLLFVDGLIVNPLLFLLLIISTSLIFSSLGLIAGLWAEDWDQLNIWSNFVLTPLVFLGGVFHSLEFVPDSLIMITLVNPIFYMVDSFRFSMLGISESNILAGLSIILVLAIATFFFTVYLFKIGYKIRK